MAVNTNIFLCGFMGSGKSTVGKKLASLINLLFVDLDDYIEQFTGKTIPSIFENEGEDHFRKLESGLLAHVLASPGEKVIALGGGTVCFHDNLELIKSSGILVYLEMPPKALAQRIGESKHSRPLVKNKSGEELLNFVTTTLESRKAWYQQAHISVNGLNLTAQQLQQLLLGFL